MRVVPDMRYILVVITNAVLDDIISSLLNCLVAVYAQMGGSGLLGCMIWHVIWYAVQLVLHHSHPLPEAPTVF
jgi:hypothetical protein